VLNNAGRWRAGCAAGAAAARANVDTEGVRTVYEAQRYDVEIKAAERQAARHRRLRGARLITMKAIEVIPNGDVLVTTIASSAIGRARSVKSRRARRRSTSAARRSSGYVDIHAHNWFGWGVHAIKSRSSWRVSRMASPRSAIRRRRRRTSSRTLT
jgi:hypothetical protein